MGGIVIASTIVWFLAAMLIVRRLQGHEKWAVFWFVSAFAWLFDVAVGLMLDLYDYGRTHKVDLEDLLSVSTINPSIALLYLNFLPKTTLRRLLYTAGWVAFLLAYEWLWLKLGLMRYKGWSMWRSLLSYLIIFLIVVYHLKWYRHLVKKAAG